MAKQYQINNLQGNEPYNIYVCNTCDTPSNTYCEYVVTLNNSDLPYIIDLPNTFENASEYCFVSIDSQDCLSCDCVNTTQGVSPTPTPTITPSITPTISITPSITPTISITPSITPTISITPSITPTISITPSITPTISITPSITPTISITPSITPTISITPSITPTISITPSITPTISITPSITSTMGTTPTPSVTITPTPTRTPIPEGSFVLNIQANYSPVTGRPQETSVDYIATISQTWPVTINVNFQDVIYKNDSTNFIGQNLVTIQNGNLTSTVTKTLSIPYEILTQVTEFQNISWSVNSSPAPEFEYILTGYTYVGGIYTTPTPTTSITPSVTPTISFTPSITPSEDIGPQPGINTIFVYYPNL